MYIFAYRFIDIWTSHLYMIFILLLVLHLETGASRRGPRDAVLRNTVRYTWRTVHATSDDRTRVEFASVNPILNRSTSGEQTHV